MAILIHRCGCHLSLPLPEGQDEYVIDVRGPNQVDRFKLRFRRITPDTFVDALDPTPEWARALHQMVPLDVKKLKGVTPLGMTRLMAILGPWTRAVGAPVVPMCMLPELMTGSGRFFGIWRTAEVPGVVHGHLRLIDKDAV